MFSEVSKHNAAYWTDHVCFVVVFLSVLVKHLTFEGNISLLLGLSLIFCTVYGVISSR